MPPTPKTKDSKVWCRWGWGRETVKTWAIDPVGLTNIQLEVSENLQQTNGPVGAKRSRRRCFLVKWWNCELRIKAVIVYLLVSVAWTSAVAEGLSLLAEHVVIHDNSMNRAPSKHSNSSRIRAQVMRNSSQKKCLTLPTERSKKLQ